jgi:glyoxylase-like metal-dependent hydrolase (beta-lactamase superfamily II)
MEQESAESNSFEVRRGITIVPVRSATIPPATHTNCILVGDRDLYVIDPGASDAAELCQVTDRVNQLIDRGGRVVAVLLTHSHPDHTAGAEYLRRLYEVPIMGHQAAAAQVSFAVDRFLNDGDVLTSEHDPQCRLQCLHTPGHDPGHLCFLESQTGVLLAGDMVANPGTIVVSRQYAGDMSHFLQSLERLLAVECQMIVPAHGQPSDQPRELIQRQLEHRLWREAKIERAYAAGATTFDQLLAQAYDDAASSAMPLARHALDAHLAKLGIELPAGL